MKFKKRDKARRNRGEDYIGLGPPLRLAARSITTQKKKKTRSNAKKNLVAVVNNCDGKYRCELEYM